METIVFISSSIGISLKSELAERTIAKLNELTEEEFAELSFEPAKEIE